MTLQLGRMFGDGIGRVFTRTGGLLFVGLLAIQFLVQSSINTAVLGLFPPEATGELEGMLGLTLPVSGTVAGVLLAAAFLLSSAYFVVLSRALTRPRDELSTFPSSLYTRRIGRATLSNLGGGVLVGFSVSIGLALLVLPGLFLAVCFLFFVFAVGVEDRRAIGALRRSWALSRGNRLKLAVVVIAAGVIGAVVGAVGAVFELAGTPLVAELLSNTIGSALFVLLYGVMAAAYLGVRDEESDGFGGSEASGPTGDPTASDV
ncbi:MAG: hypothetical protein V5A62_11080 [Haloarculaceae archaeon]